MLFERVQFAVDQQSAHDAHSSLNSGSCSARAGVHAGPVAASGNAPLPLERDSSFIDGEQIAHD